MRDSYQFTAELRKVLHSLPPRAARAACEALRNPPTAAAAAGRGGDVSAARGKKRGRWTDAPPCRGQGVGAGAPADASSVASPDGDDELAYMTQVSSLFCGVLRFWA